MSLLSIIDRIEQMMIAGEPLAQIRPHLFNLRDQAEALEKEVKARNRKAQTPKMEKALDTIASLKKQIEQLQTKPKAHVHRVIG